MLRWIDAYRGLIQRLHGNPIFTAMDQIGLTGFQGIQLLRLAFAAMTAILFLQSGFSKLFDRKGEKQWLTAHFAKSILKGTVPVLLPVITLLEIIAGICSAIAMGQVLLTGGTRFGSLGMLLGTAAIILLFLGQRVAKDYAGAASLIPYFLMCAAGVYVYTA